MPARLCVEERELGSPLHRIVRCMIDPLERPRVGYVLEPRDGARSPPDVAQLVEIVGAFVPDGDRHRAHRHNRAGGDEELVARVGQWIGGRAPISHHSRRGCRHLARCERLALDGDRPGRTGVVLVMTAANPADDAHVLRFVKVRTDLTNREETIPVAD